MTIPSKTTIKLDEPLQTHAGFVNEISFRAPKVDDYYDVGDLISYVRLPSGAVVPQDNLGAYRQYAERLVQAPVTALDLGNGGLRLAGQIRDAIDGFFTAARPKVEPSKDSPNNSGGPESSASNISNE